MQLVHCVPLALAGILLTAVLSIYGACIVVEKRPADTRQLEAHLTVATF